MISLTIEELLETDVKKGFNELESTADGLDIYGEEFFKEGVVLPLLCELSAQDKLPAILFQFDREGCVDLALHILEQLELAENEKRASDLVYQAKKKEAISQREIREKELKRKRDKEEVDIKNPSESEESIPPIFD
jgi:superfamily II RNA helicase